MSVRPSSCRLRRRSKPGGFTKAAALLCIYIEHILSKRFRLGTDGLEHLVTPTFAKKRHGVLSENSNGPIVFRLSQVIPLFGWSWSDGFGSSLGHCDRLFVRIGSWRWRTSHFDSKSPCGRRFGRCGPRRKPRCSASWARRRGPARRGGWPACFILPSRSDGDRVSGEAARALSQVFRRARCAPYLVGNSFPAGRVSGQGHRHRRLGSGLPRRHRPLHPVEGRSSCRPSCIRR